MHGSHNALRGSCSCVASLGLVLPVLPQNLFPSIPPLSKLSPVDGFLFPICEWSDCIDNHTLHGYFVFYGAFLGPFCVLIGVGAYMF